MKVKYSPEGKRRIISLGLAGAIRTAARLTLLDCQADFHAAHGVTDTDEVSRACTVLAEYIVGRLTDRELGPMEGDL